MKRIVLILLLSLQAILAEEIYATFDVMSINESKLSLSRPGIIDTLNADIGDTVKKGQILLSLDNREEKADVALAQTNAERAKVSYDYAKRTYNRYQKLKDVVDEEEFERVELDMIAHEKEWRSKERTLALKKITLEKTRLYAPYNGVITEKHVEKGDGVAGPQTILFTISKRPGVKLLIQFDQKHWGVVKKGQTFSYRVDGMSKIQKTKLTKVYPTADSATRKLKAEALAKDILPGLFGDGSIITE